MKEGKEEARKEGVIRGRFRLGLGGNNNRWANKIRRRG